MHKTFTFLVYEQTMNMVCLAKAKVTVFEHWASFEPQITTYLKTLVYCCGVDNEVEPIRGLGTNICFFSPVATLSW